RYSRPRLSSRAQLGSCLRRLWIMRRKKAPAPYTREGLLVSASWLTQTASMPLSPGTPRAAPRIPFCTLPSRKSISFPQTGCGIRIPSHRLSFHKQGQLSSLLLLENLFLWPPLTAMTFPFSAVLQVTDPVHLFLPAFSSA